MKIEKRTASSFWFGTTNKMQKLGTVLSSNNIPKGTFMNCRTHIVHINVHLLRSLDSFVENGVKILEFVTNQST